MEYTHYQIGFIHGAAGAGTNGYKPGARRGENLERYQSGFQHGMRVHHDATASRRAELAAINLPRGER